MGTPFSWVGRRLQPLRDFLFPALCFSCNERLRDDEIRICAVCWNSISRVLPEDDTYRILSARFVVGGAIDGFWSYCYFEHGGVFQKLAHALKYEGITWCGEELGRRLASALPDDLVVDAVIPIPLHSVRLRERGYNQSECVCRGIQQRRPFTVMPSLLRRIKNTTTQTHLNAEERRSNISAAFEITPKHMPFISGRSFLLVDDVITTGSTLQEAAALLKRSGAVAVYASSAGLAQLDGA